MCEEKGFWKEMIKKEEFDWKTGFFKGKSCIKKRRTVWKDPCYYYYYYYFIIIIMIIIMIIIIIIIFSGLRLRRRVVLDCFERERERERKCE